MKEGELERYVRLAAARAGDGGRIVVPLDANGFWAVTARANRRVTVRCEVVKLALVQHSDDSGRVTLMGDVPVGPEGSPSTMIEGEPIEPAR